MAPALIVQSMLVAKSSRPEHSTEAFTWSSTGLLAGVGVGLTAGGALTSPGADVMAQGPTIILFCAGLAFVFAGLTCAIRARAASIDDLRIETRERPAPQAGHRVLAIAAAGTLATAGTWIAIASGPLAFGVSAPPFEAGAAGEKLGRAVVALGATIAWIYVIALCVNTVRRLLDRDG